MKDTFNQISVICSRCECLNAEITVQVFVTLQHRKSGRNYGADKEQYIMAYGSIPNHAKMKAFCLLWNRITCSEASVRNLLTKIGCDPVFCKKLNSILYKYYEKICVHHQDIYSRHTYTPISEKRIRTGPQNALFFFLNSCILLTSPASYKLPCTYLRLHFFPLSFTLETLRHPSNESVISFLPSFDPRDLWTIWLNVCVRDGPIVNRHKVRMPASRSLPEGTSVCFLDQSAHVWYRSQSPIVYRQFSIQSLM